MKAITSIIAPKKRRELAAVEFDDGGKAEVRVETIARFHLREGSEVTEARWQEVLRVDATERCRAQAWKLLSMRMRSRKELERGLRQRKYDAPVVEDVLGELEAKGYLDDRAFATQFARERAGRMQGIRRVERDLVARGIKREAAGEIARAATTPDHEEESARGALMKWNRRKKPEDPQKRAQAAASFLLRRGFDGDLVWKLMREFFKA
ncbi:regulatory protein RecX [Candidatus Sumerlaeota bacterium]|nr:regulatory protein RecX [Candidatus Sumerlaeota bacterium]